MIAPFFLTSNAHPFAADLSSISSSFFARLFSKNIPLFGAVHRYTNKCTTLLKRLITNDIFSGYALPSNV